MLYIIDANNLAGQLEILNENNFDKILIELIKKWPASLKNKIILVFDSIDPLGDKYTDGNITVVYTPRDSYYRSADDKIIEIAAKEIRSGYPEFGSLTIITDDLGLTKEIQKYEEKTGNKLTIMKATAFARKLESLTQEQGIEPDNKNDRGLEHSDINKINSDLLKIWK